MLIGDFSARVTGPTAHSNGAGMAPIINTRTAGGNDIYATIKDYNVSVITSGKAAVMSLSNL